MIEQVRFSKSIKAFEANFCKKWNVVPYYDINKPCLFMGVYDIDDATTINNHKSLKIIFITGRLRKVYKHFKLINPKNVVLKVTKNSEDYIYDNFEEIKNKYKIKYCNFPIKDYSMFIPNILGNKIYCYLGSWKRRKYLGYNVIEEIKKNTPFEILYGFQGHTIEDLKANFYDKCFINIKPGLATGITSATELAYMGRYTISNSKIPFCIGYSNIDDIIKIINQEAKKIGTIQSSLVGDYHDVDIEWKQINFWI